MEDNKKVIDVEENEINEVEEIEETKLEKIKNSKPVTFMKKHGKKIAVGAVIGAAFLIGRALGAKEESDYGEYDDSDDDVIELDHDDYSVSEETTEDHE